MAPSFVPSSSTDLCHGTAPPKRRHPSQCHTSFFLFSFILFSFLPLLNRNDCTQETSSFFNVPRFPSLFIFHLHSWGPVGLPSSRLTKKGTTPFHHRNLISFFSNIAMVSIFLHNLNFFSTAIVPIFLVFSSQQQAQFFPCVLFTATTSLFSHSFSAIVPIFFPCVFFTAATPFSFFLFSLVVHVQGMSSKNRI